MKKPLKFIQLPSADKTLFVKTVFLIWTTRLALALFPFSFVNKIFGRLSRRERSRPFPTKGRIIWAAEAAGRHIPFAGNCLAKAMATQIVLRRAGYEATVRIGVELPYAADRPARSLRAHAWVECGGDVVVGRWAAEHDYRPLASTLAAALFFIFSGVAALAADVPQTQQGSSAEVQLKKKVKELEESLTYRDTIPKLTLEEEPPPPAQETTKAEFYVKKIRVEGSDAIPQAELDKSVSVFEERTQTVDSLNVLCRQLETQYQQMGYIVIVYMPPQRLENQEVTLKVVVSTLGELHLEGARYFRESRTLSYWRIPKGRPLRFEELRANVLKMNENPDRSVRVLLKPGKEQGLTDVYLKEEDRYPFHNGIGIDNEGTKLTGKARPSLNFRHNNFTGNDDTFFGSTAFGREVGMLYLYHLLPIPQWDARLATHFSHSRVSPKKEFKELDYHGVSQDYGFELRRYILKRDNAVIDGYAGFTFNEKRTRAVGQVITRDRLRVPSFGVDVQTADKDGVWILGESWTFGLAYHDDDVRLMSRDAGSSFSKFNGSLRRIQRLPDHARGVLNFEGQWTKDDLTPQEQFFMGGANSIRGYPESDYGGDYGYMFNAEYWHPASFLPEDWKVMGSEGSLNKQIELGVFYDMGYGRLIKPTATDHVSRTLMSVGTGLNFNFNENLQASIGWGFPIGDLPITESGSSQFHFKIQSNF